MTQQEIKDVILEVLNVDFTTTPADDLKENFAQKISEAINTADQDKYDELKEYVDEQLQELKDYVDTQIASVRSSITSSTSSGLGGIGGISKVTIPTL